MFSNDEKLYMELGQRFRDELAQVDKQIQELQERRNELLHMLFPEPTKELAPKAGTDVPTHPKMRKSDETLNSLVDFIRQHPGVGRQELEEGWCPQGMSAKALGNVLTRAKRRGLIASTGPGRNAVWAPVER